MTQNLEALTQRAESMGGIRSIVHTMKTLSVINAAPYDHAVRAIAAYHDTVLDGLHAFVSQVRPFDTVPKKTSQDILITFGSDHGLCGNYNTALASYIVEQHTKFTQKITVLCVGARLADALRDRGIVPETTFLPAASVDGIGKLSNVLTQHLDTLRAGQDKIAVSLAFVTRDAAIGQRPTLTALLPLDPALVADLQSKPWMSRSLPSFSMRADDLFRALIRNHVFATMFRAAAEALMTENAARLALMQQAEQAVDDRLDDLRSDMRSVRQSEITTELLDMIIGFEALKKAKKA